MTFFVVAIDVVSPDVDLGNMLHGTARKFAPHITILPRVEGSALRNRSVWGWREVVAAVERLRGEPLDLLGPVQVADDLRWYESAAGCRGHAALFDVHRLAADRLLDPMVPGPESGFVGRGYRPHLTTSWHSPGGGAAMPHVLRVRAVNLVVYSYRRAPWDSAVRREPIDRITAVHG